MPRRRRKRKNREFQKFFICVILFAMLVFADRAGLLANVNQANQTIGKTSQKIQELKQRYTPMPEIVESVSNNIKIDNSKLNIIYFYVGQADCTLIIEGNHTMLIDSGNSKDGDNLVNALKALNINKIDYVIGTHVHEDHIGCMSDIVDNFEIGKFYLPYNESTTTSFYKRLLKSLMNKNTGIDEAVIGDKFSLGKAEVEIMSVDNSDPENINEESIVVELRYGNQKYLFMGDAEVVNESSRLWNDVDVLKVGHHGSNTSTSQEFLLQTKPEIAIISVGRNNSYDLPKNKILKRLENIGSKIYRTDEDGTIQLVSDGNQNEIIKVPLDLDGNDE